MSYLRFQHVYVGLLGLSALSAFVIPPKYTLKVEPQIQGLFAPIARPAGLIADWLHNRVSPPALKDQRKNEDIREENRHLWAQVASLSTQLEELRQRVAERSKLGDVGRLCTLVKVVGGDPGSRDSISLAASTLEGVQNEQYVLCQSGLVGQVERAGLGGAQVRLITDASFRIRGSFAHFARDAKGNPQLELLGTPIVIVEGLGHGKMVVRSLTFEEAHQKLHEGDSIVLMDKDCPSVLEGWPLGRIERIGHLRDAHVFAEIRIEPTTTLTRLREVMVMTKER